MPSSVLAAEFPQGAGPDRISRQVDDEREGVVVHSDHDSTSDRELLSRGVLVDEEASASDQRKENQDRAWNSSSHYPRDANRATLLPSTERIPVTEISPGTMEIPNRVPTAAHNELSKKTAPQPSLPPVPPVTSNSLSIEDDPAKGGNLPANTPNQAKITTPIISILRGSSHAHDTAQKLEQTSAEPKLCLLMSLPPEMRNTIFIYALVVKDPLVISKRPLRVVGLAGGPRHATALLQTCRQIRDECTGLFYHGNTFHIEDTRRRINDSQREEANVVEDFLNALPRAALLTISQIIVKLNRWPCSDRHFMINALDTILTLVNIRAERRLVLARRVYILFWRVTCYCGHHYDARVPKNELVALIDLDDPVTSFRREARRFYDTYLLDRLKYLRFGLASHRMIGVGMELERRLRPRLWHGRLRFSSQRRVLP